MNAYCSASAPTASATPISYLWRRLPRRGHVQRRRFTPITRNLHTTEPHANDTMQSYPRPARWPPPFALAMHLKCNQRKPKPKQTLLPHRASQASQEPTASSQPTYQPTARQATSTLLSNELRCESRSIVRKCHSVGGNKNAFGKLQKFPLSIGFASQLD